MTEYKKSAAVLVFNDKGELVLQLRAARDDSFPSHWDTSAAGGIDSGEDTARAAKRELSEELGVEADVTFISKESFTYPAWKSSVMREIESWIYTAHHNGPFRPDPKEVENVEFFTFAEIERMITSGEKFHPEFVSLWKRGVVNKAREVDSLIVVRC